jgi:multicomponent Na+:H+ antiporter subunit D
LFLAIAGFAARGAGPSLAGLAGLARRMPFTAAAFVVAGFSLIGLPGTAGFIGKWYLVVAAAEHGAIGMLLAVPLVTGSVLAVVYVWRVVESLYFGASAEPPAPALVSMRERFTVTTLLLWIVVLANVYFGVRPALQTELAATGAAALLGVFGAGG